MTPKQMVLKIFPRAEIDKDGWSPSLGFFDFGIFVDDLDTNGIGQGASPSAAWADAARRLRGSENRKARGKER